ncbi:MAG: hypothetical protein JXA11_11995 [Phycisphaerae bacterium]|nr:hypothetical protein [Phycisphaerae bacterium]
MNSRQRNVKPLTHGTSGIDGLLRTDRKAPWRNYAHTLVRYENRHLPTGDIDGIPVEQAEQLLANLGVDARWISVVHACQGAIVPSEHLPLMPDAKPEYDRNLREWVQILHNRRMCAITWYPLCYNHAAAEKHPDWRQEFLVPPPEGNIHHEFACCINSPYGRAVKNFILESLQKYDLDGVYFDGSSLTPVWEKPFPVSCVCPHCREKFRDETGLETPTKLDWTSPEFRRWVQWRYDMFSAYWQELTDAIHAAVPEAAVIFNHYHRERIPWVGAVPLKSFGRNFLRGTEADSQPLRGMFYTRCMRAAGKEGTEVWMNINPHGHINTPAGPKHNVKPVLDFMLACAAAGGHAATGCGTPAIEWPTLQRLADALGPFRAYLDLPSVPHAALHVSQQTDTFVFGRNPGVTTDANWTDHYWASLVGWADAIAMAGRYCDVVYDDHLTLTKLKKFPLLIMPLAPALAKKQWNTVLQYVRTGGTLVTGPWFGVCDEWGEPRGEPLGGREIFPFGSEFPTFEELDSRKERGLREKTLPLDWNSRHLIRRAKMAKGEIIQLSLDVGTLFRHSSSPLVVSAVAELLETLPRPCAEPVSEELLLTGVFQKNRRTVAVHLQPCTSPWPSKKQPNTHQPIRGILLRWNGNKPKLARCATPTPGPGLPIRKRGKHWRIELPPLPPHGMVILIEQ